VAGTILGALGSLILAGWVVMLITAGAQVYALGMKWFAAYEALQKGEQRIQQHQRQEGALPSTSAGTDLVDDVQDPWGQSLRYERKNADYRVISAGPDKQFGTSDDVRFKTGTIHMGSDSDFGTGGNTPGQPGGSGDAANGT
jgi:hypothetical protein